MGYDEPEILRSVHPVKCPSLLTADIPAQLCNDAVIDRARADMAQRA
jgi:hypothetical protein